MAETPGRAPFGGLAEGRESAFEALYDRFAARLFRATWGMTGSREAAEDAVQEVFVGLLRAGGRLREARDLPPEQREVVAPEVDGGPTFAEIAGVLDISAKTAASRYRHTLERLRAALKGSEDDGRAAP